LGLLCVVGRSWRGGACEPAIVNRFEDGYEVRETVRLDVVVASAEVGGFFYVGIIGRGREYDDWQVFEFGTGGNPFEDVKAGEVGHFEVEQEESGEGML